MLNRKILFLLVSVSPCIVAAAHAQSQAPVVVYKPHSPSIRSSASAQSPAPVVIYSDSLASGWNDWSFGADRDLASTKAPHAGSNAIAVTAKAWGTLGLHSEGVDVAHVSTLSLWVNGGDTGGQQLSVTLNGQPGIPFAVKLPPLTKGWTHVELPLSKLGLTQSTPLTLVWIQNVTGNDAATYYVDDIEMK